MKTTKILLTGASGLLGRSLMASLAPLGELTGTAHSRLTPPLVRLDLTDDTALPAALAAWAPDLVVHSAAERRPDVVDGDPAQAEKLNVRATATLAQLAAARGALLPAAREVIRRRGCTVGWWGVGVAWWLPVGHGHRCLSGGEVCG